MMIVRLSGHPLVQDSLTHRRLELPSAAAMALLDAVLPAVCECSRQVRLVSLSALVCCTVREMAGAAREPCRSVRPRLCPILIGEEERGRREERRERSG